MPLFGMIQVVEARALGPARLWVRFGDGVEGSVDLSSDIPGAFIDDLRDPAFFARVTITGCGLEWPNGFDCAPEWLYDRVLEANGTEARRNGDEWKVLQRHARGVPEISRFFGIVIRMFFSDHARPHFHAEHGEHAISIEIDGDGVAGSFPPARLPMLFEWRDRHRAELLANWERLRLGKAAQPIPPLE